MIHTRSQGEIWVGLIVRTKKKVKNHKTRTWRRMKGVVTEEKGKWINVLWHNVKEVDSIEKKKVWLLDISSPVPKYGRGERDHDDTNKKMKASRAAEDKDEDDDGSDEDQDEDEDEDDDGSDASMPAFVAHHVPVDAVVVGRRVD